MNDKIQAMRMVTMARAIDLINEQERRIAELEAALSRRPAAAPEAPDFSRPIGLSRQPFNATAEADRMILEAVAVEARRANVELMNAATSVIGAWDSSPVNNRDSLVTERIYELRQARDAVLAAPEATPSGNGAAEQPAAEQAKAAHVGWRNEKDGRPPAAGNALTDEQEHAEFMQHFPMPEGLRASVYDAWQHDQLRRKEGWEAAIKHLRAAPQAAQGKGLTIDTPQFRVLVSSVAWESRTAPSDAFEAALNRLIAHIDQTIAAHTRASDGKDGERLEQMLREEYASYCEAVGRHGVKPYTFNEYRAKAIEKIDAAMQQAASNQQEGA